MSYLDAPSKIDLTGVESSELLDNEHLNQHDRVDFLCLVKRMFSGRFSSFFNQQNDRKVFHLREIGAKVLQELQTRSIKIFVRVAEGNFLYVPIFCAKFFRYI